MGWLRSRLKRISSIALFAMGLQLALSFGHIHLDHVLGGSGQTAVHRADAATTLRTSADELPAGANDECAICALIALANSLILPLPVLLPAPAHFALEQHAPTIEFYVAQTTLHSFRARAPPLV